MSQFVSDLSHTAKSEGQGFNVLLINTTSLCLPTNPLSSFASATTKPALGPTFSYLTDLTLFVSTVESLSGFLKETSEQVMRQLKILDAAEDSSKKATGRRLGLLVIEVMRSRRVSCQQTQWTMVYTDGVSLKDVPPAQ